MRRLRPFLLMLATSVFFVVLVTWSFVLWSPYTHVTMPAEEPLFDGYPDTVPGPDGLRAWWFTKSGVGVMETVPSGAKGTDGGGFSAWWGGFTPAYYRGGWPMLAMQSVVRVQKNFHGRELVGWELPRGEIFRRGLQTDSLPGWLCIQPGRRLPLVPLWAGFGIDALAYFTALGGLRYLWFCFKQQTRAYHGHRALATGAAPHGPDS